MEPIDPRFVPKMARKLAKWTRELGPDVWPTQAIQGTHYWTPPGVPPLVHETAAFSANQLTGKAFRLPTKETVDSYLPLISYYAETLEQAKYFHLESKMTNLALRTQMSKYKLTLDTLRIAPHNGFVPWGFITWAMPIGQAENNTTTGAMIDFRTGELSAPELPSFNPYQDADFPVVAALWRYHPEANSVWVAFYTEPTDHLRIQREQGASPAKLAQLKKFTPPLMFEREQELPLDQTLNWCDADPDDGPRLPLTAWRDASEFPEHIQEAAERNNALAKTSVSDMVRVLISSWMIMRWKIAERKVIPPTQDVIRKVAKETGRSKEAVARDGGTTIVKLGAPIRKQGSGREAGAKKGAWKVRALVGPVIRDRQYIPAWDTYDENPRFIEPFWMGPADAPISNPDRVFVLDDQSSASPATDLPPGWKPPELDRRGKLQYQALTRMSEGVIARNATAAELAECLGISVEEAEEVCVDLTKPVGQLIEEGRRREARGGND